LTYCASSRRYGVTDAGLIAASMPSEPGLVTVANRGTGIWEEPQRNVDTGRGRKAGAGVEAGSDQSGLQSRDERLIDTRGPRERPLRNACVLPEAAKILSE